MRWRSPTSSRTTWTSRRAWARMPRCCWSLQGTLARCAAAGLMPHCGRPAPLLLGPGGSTGRAAPPLALARLCGRPVTIAHGPLRTSAFKYTARPCSCQVPVQVCVPVRPLASRAEGSAAGCEELLQHLWSQRLPVECLAPSRRLHVVRNMLIRVGTLSGSAAEMKRVSGRRSPASCAQPWAAAPTSSSTALASSRPCRCGLCATLAVVPALHDNHIMRPAVYIYIYIYLRLCAARPWLASGLCALPALAATDTLHEQTCGT